MTSPSSELPRRKRSLFARMVIGLCKLLGWLVAAVVLLAVILAVWPDSSSPKDDDMRPKQSASGPNPLTTLVAWIEEKNFDLDDKEVRMAKQPGPRGTAAADSLIAANGAALEQFKTLASATGDRWSWNMQGGPSLELETKSRPYSRVGELLQMEWIHARRIAEKGNTDEALELALAFIRIGNRLFESSDTLISWVFAVAPYGIGLALIEEIAVREDITPEQIERLQRSLAEIEPDTAISLGEAMKGEYAMFSRWLDEVAARRIEVKNLDFKVPSPALFYLNPNDTRTCYLERIRPVVQALPLDWSGVSGALKRYEENLRPRTYFDICTFFVSSNAFGKYVGLLTTSSWYHPCRRAFELVAKHRVAVCQLAVRRYQLKHGRLPETLTQLAPEFLPSVPADPYDGGLLKWTFREDYLEDDGSRIPAHVVYAVGENQVDDHGSIDVRMRGRFPDQGTPYWWDRKKKTE